MLTCCAAQTQGRNIRRYANYLTERARAYRDTKIDWVRAGEGRLERLSVDKGLLRETETVLHQLAALLKCDVSIVWLFLKRLGGKTKLTDFRFWIMRARLT